MRRIINADFSGIFIVIQKHISPSPTDIFLGLPDIKFLFIAYRGNATQGSGQNFIGQPLIGLDQLL
jgi:hypothetical protein